MNKKSDKRSFVLKQPKTEKDAANLVRVDKWVGLSRFAIQDDIAYLILKFKSKTTHTLHDFHLTWNELQFQLIHFSCLQKTNRKEFICAFYSYTLDYLESSLDFYHSAVVFALYYLYFTQPNIWNMIRIRVNRETWAKLCHFYAESVEQEQNSEAALVFERLREEEAFDFVVEERVDNSFLQERDEFKDARKVLDKLHELHLERIRQDNTEAFFDVEHYESLLQEYKDAKKRALCTPQMTKLAQDSFEEKFHFKETNIDRLAKYARDIGLMDDTVLSIETPHKRRIDEKIETIALRNEKKKREWNEHYGLQSD